MKVTNSGLARLIVILTICIVFNFIGSANAYPLKLHLQQEVSAAMTGAYFSITNDQEDLVNNSSLYITKEMWVAFGSEEWIEVGTVRGVIENPDLGYIDWNGHFMAWNLGATYRERNFQNEYPTGIHNFEVTNVNGTWTVYMDYTQVATVPQFDGYSNAVKQIVGIETGDTSNSFVDGTYAAALQYRNTSGTWKLWNSSGVTPSDSSNPDTQSILGWTSTYNSSINRLTFNN